jgi:uncharacterized protein (DUF1330 family)
MAAYILANVKVTNPEQYEDYRRLSTLAMKERGAEVLVRGGKTTVLEGDWTPERIVLLKFSTAEAAQAFYDSPEYRAAREAREGIAIMRMVLIEGV